MDLTGKRFGRYTAIKPVKTSAGTKWLCKCDCGNEKLVFAHNLLRGTSKSCGCLQREQLAERNKNRRPALGESESRLYRLWKSMKRRCNGKGYTHYNLYGGRGIRVCDEWQSYVPFRDWALANGYDPAAPSGECTLDRINVDGDYGPENCRFVNMRTQADNRRKTRHITFAGETLNIAEWARRYDLPENVLWYRVNAGWEFEKAISTAVAGR